jgi:magnesium chelatase family protein
MTSKSLDEFVPLESKVKDFLVQAVSKLNLSSRVVHRIIKLARTIADMESSEQVGINHLAEALQYRNKNLFVEQ